jgi:hypothetical protein
VMIDDVVVVETPKDELEVDEQPTTKRAPRTVPTAKRMTELSRPDRSRTNGGSHWFRQGESADTASHVGFKNPYWYP